MGSEFSLDEYILIDRKAGDILQKYLVLDYLEGFLSPDEEWAYKHLLESGSFNAPGLSRSGIK